MGDFMTERIVTPAQLREGYVRLVNSLDNPRTIRGDYCVIRRMADGNYVVEEPR